MIQKKRNRIKRDPDLILSLQYTPKTPIKSSIAHCNIKITPEIDLQYASKSYWLYKYILYKNIERESLWVSFQPEANIKIIDENVNCYVRII